MSDSDFQELVEGMERFVVKELSSVKKEVIDIKTNINIESKITMTKLSDIEKRIGEIEKKMGNIEETLKRAVGKEVVNLFQQMLEGIEGGHPTPPPTSTPFAQQLSPSHNQEEEDILEKYIQPSTSSDKLTSRQAGFVRYFLNNHKSDKITDILVNTCITEGLKMGVWGEDFCPEGTSDLHKYLRDRLKNEKKVVRRSGLRKDQQQRLSTYLDDSMKEMYVRSGEEQMEG